MGQEISVEERIVEPLIQEVQQKANEAQKAQSNKKKDDEDPLAMSEMIDSLAFWGIDLANLKVPPSAAAAAAATATASASLDHETSSESTNDNDDTKLPSLPPASADLESQQHEAGSLLLKSDSACILEEQSDEDDEDTTMELANNKNDSVGTIRMKRVTVVVLSSSQPGARDTDLEAQGKTKESPQTVDGSDLRTPLLSLQADNDETVEQQQEEATTTTTALCLPKHVAPSCLCLHFLIVCMVFVIPALCCLKLPIFSDRAMEEHERELVAFYMLVQGLCMCFLLPSIIIRRCKRTNIPIGKLRLGAILFHFVSLLVGIVSMLGLSECLGLESMFGLAHW
eukprot:CAMPEP_0118710680 /NCGR_PEP_ID=MMETSP0800-20121206/23548_1 /TAXON_ID=210618 ORGANISM="Striatella unipunctata, Strain CCMP2910" /NCGR_SAMPLE_ID=MMETSP0800 /ASSEMBLY_ACC=CAM_ASM_000638 /LENGTH=340 /DNA_ID=CAMNT_0006614953 /DNA_START=33 /DNA_END=1052 /DNA_ORIENTATION=-